MRLLKFVMFLFYRYYSTGGTYQIPYFSALVATVFLIYIHIFQIFLILDTVSWFPMHPGDTKLMKYGKLALFLLPIFLIVAYLIKEKDLKNAEYDEDKIRNGGRGLIVYAILSFILLFVLAVVLQRHSLGG